MTFICRLAHSVRLPAGCPRGALPRLRQARRGQSLVEFTLIAPIMVIVLLGMLNLGLAIRAHLQVAQEAQEAAQILAHHPEYADSFVVTVSGATGGTFTVTTSDAGGGSYTTAVAFGASPATLQAAVAGLTDVGAGNVLVTESSTGAPYTVTFTGTSTATGLTVNGASLTPNGATATSTSKIVDFIDNTLGGSYPVTDARDPTAGGNQSRITVTVGTALLTKGCTITSTNNCLVVQDTVKIDYYFRVLFPMAGNLSVGAFQSGYINLGATQSTIVASQPPSNVTVCVVWEDKSVNPVAYHGCPDINSGVGLPADLGKHEVFWNRPKEAEPSPAGVQVPLAYCLTSYYPALFGTPPVKNVQSFSLGCIVAPNPSGTAQHWVDPSASSQAQPQYTAAPNAYNGPSGINYVQTTSHTPPIPPSPASISYSLTAQQDNGITSTTTARSSVVHS